MPGPIQDWCGDALGSAPGRVIFASERMSSVWGVELGDDRRVVIKARCDPTGRARSIVEAQQLLAFRGFPCPVPLTGVGTIDGWGSVHAEAWLETGAIDVDDSPAAGARSGAVLARQVGLCLDLAGQVSQAPPLPNPPWVHWDHDGPDLWPPDSLDADHVPVRPVAPEVLEAATRARARLLRDEAPTESYVLGHVDWETQHLRWEGQTAVVVHDWDSLAWLPEAAIAGVGSGTFASNDVPTLAPLASSLAFLESYQQTRGVSFSADECELAHAAALFTAAHNAQMQSAYGREPIAERALLAQCAERLALAGAV